MDTLIVLRKPLKLVPNTTDNDSPRRAHNTPVPFVCELKNCQETDDSLQKISFVKLYNEVCAIHARDNSQPSLMVHHQHSAGDNHTSHSVAHYTTQRTQVMFEIDYANN